MHRKRRVLEVMRLQKINNVQSSSFDIYFCSLYPVLSRLLAQPRK